MPSIKTIRKKGDKKGASSFNYQQRFSRYIAVYFTWIFLKLKITPNAITISNIFLGFFGTFLMVFHNSYTFLVGIFLIYITLILDSSDGQVARITGNCSKRGQFLDGIYSYTLAAGLYGFLALGSYLILRDFRLLIAGFIAIIFTLFSSISYRDRALLVGGEPGHNMIKVRKTKRLVFLSKIASSPAMNIKELIILFYLFQRLDLLVFFFGVYNPAMWLAKVVIMSRFDK
jgi:phosphatidylglycerophosphate synthase